MKDETLILQLILAAIQKRADDFDTPFGTLTVDWHDGQVKWVKVEKKYKES